ncbi:carboxyl-terminal processing protease CtpA [Synechococcus sp. 7002]|uniref:Carboxyl-terminal-processing protease n=1 Tax=Picosynechococcus sp. (strain ATCC 27264 / PCC 7002 / PR-6) TaxID=32049 RepID=CTPA_PICP2|nr:carboxyl-terminal processing protease CtpA [Synechococcus sp. 7002]P42784.2 RecName: Full=Carboxyl-terminal-processing protease; AltName: Full=CtpA; Flags: Precursor [Picosynechococcus sp. PCC 7002]ACA98847.1 carboxyl-terminal protease [Picosynechococcus sp. PCC 7002]SMH37892.1 C-terminal processing peptidase-2. Serine peptidase. MEROPS family S41A [Picosynechococcus sp. OG1]SMQ77936.1 C-terminal processing peptidase-2. Serine peptidase. MEROPS family S41A [Synechococcus sp. 7002]
MLRKRLQAGLCSLLLVLVLVFGPMERAIAFTDEQDLLLQAWRYVSQAYVDETFNHQNWWLIRQKFLKRPLKTRDEAYEAVGEMLALLDDPYTRLLRPEQYRSLKVSTSGELSGVGLQINVNPEVDVLEVILPLPGSPAEAAGIEAKDQILAIDGIDTRNIGLEEAAARMRGKKGSTVSLTVKSPKTDTVRTVKVTRDTIALNPVYDKLDEKNGEKVGYIRLNQFSANAKTEIIKSLNQLQKQGADRYVLDLRNNPGGLLQAGIEIARLWLDQETIVYTVNRQGIFESYSAVGQPLTDAPLVVLVNQATASASEILAGALQDNGRAMLVGEKTFGKGLIQSLFELPDGAGMAVTVAKYETPLHHDINKLGIMPDEVVPQEPIGYAMMGSETDLQYQAALDLLTQDQAIAQISQAS